MNWLAYFLLAYVAMGVQTGLGAFVRLGSPESGGAEPNFGLLAVVFIALNAERQAALLGGFILGAIQDVATQQPFGLFAFSYGLSSMLIASAAQSVYRSHPLTQFFFSLLAGCVTAGVVLAHSHFHGRSVPAVTTLGAALYTAVLAPFLVGALQRGKNLFAFRK